MIRTTISKIKKVCAIAFVPRVLGGDFRLLNSPYVTVGKFEKLQCGAQSIAGKSTKAGDTPPEPDASDQCVSIDESTLQNESETVTVNNTASMEDIWSILIGSESNSDKSKQKIDPVARSEECNRVIAGIFGDDSKPASDELTMKTDYVPVAHFNISDDNSNNIIPNARIQDNIFDKSEMQKQEQAELKEFDDALTKDSFRSVLCYEAVLMKDKNSNTDDIKQADCFHKRTADRVPANVNTSNLNDDNVSDSQIIKNTVNITRVHEYTNTVDPYWTDAYETVHEKSLLTQRYQPIDADTLKTYSRLKSKSNLYNNTMPESRKYKHTQEELARLLYACPYENDFVKNATAVKQEKEELSNDQKVEHINEKPIVEGELSKQEGFNVAQRALENNYKSVNTNKHGKIDEATTQHINPVVNRMNEYWMKDVEKNNALQERSAVNTKVKVYYKPEPANSLKTELVAPKDTSRKSLDFIQSSAHNVSPFEKSSLGEVKASEDNKPFGVTKARELNITSPQKFKSGSTDEVFNANTSADSSRKDINESVSNQPKTNVLETKHVFTSNACNTSSGSLKLLATAPVKSTTNNAGTMLEPCQSNKPTIGAKEKWVPMSDTKEVPSKTDDRLSALLSKTVTSAAVDKSMTKDKAKTTIGEWISLTDNSQTSNKYNTATADVNTATDLSNTAQSIKKLDTEAVGTVQELKSLKEPATNATGTVESLQSNTVPTTDGTGTIENLPPTTVPATNATGIVENVPPTTVPTANATGTVENLQCNTVPTTDGTGTIDNLPPTTVPATNATGIVENVPPVTVPTANATGTVENPITEPAVNAVGTEQNPQPLKEAAMYATGTVENLAPTSTPATYATGTVQNPQPTTEPVANAVGTEQNLQPITEPEANAVRPEQNPQSLKEVAAYATGTVESLKPKKESATKALEIEQKLQAINNPATESKKTVENLRTMEFKDNKPANIITKKANILSIKPDETISNGLLCNQMLQTRLMSKRVLLSGEASEDKVNEQKLLKEEVLVQKESTPEIAPRQTENINMYTEFTLEIPMSVHWESPDGNPLMPTFNVIDDNSPTKKVVNVGYKDVEMHTNVQETDPPTPTNNNNNPEPWRGASSMMTIAQDKPLLPLPRDVQDNMKNIKSYTIQEIDSSSYYQPQLHSFCSEMLATSQELHETSKQMNATFEKLQSTSEHLQATSQELLATTEELHATSEELHAATERINAKAMEKETPQNFANTQYSTINYNSEDMRDEREQDPNKSIQKSASDKQAANDNFYCENVWTPYEKDYSFHEHMKAPGVPPVNFTMGTRDVFRDVQLPDSKETVEKVTKLHMKSDHQQQAMKNVVSASKNEAKNTQEKSNSLLIQSNKTETKNTQQENEPEDKVPQDDAQEPVMSSKIENPVEHLQATEVETKLSQENQEAKEIRAEKLAKEAVTFSEGETPDESANENVAKNMKLETLAQQTATLTTPVSAPIPMPALKPLPKLNDKVKLSELLQLVRERNRLLNCSEMYTAPREEPDAARKNIPPLSQPRHNTKVYVAPGYPELKPMPRICAPPKKKSPKKTKCTSCDLKTLGLDQSLRPNYPKFESNPGISSAHCRDPHSIAINSEMPYSIDLTEDIILQLQTIGDIIRKTYEERKLEVFETAMLTKSRWLRTLNRSRDLEPWNAIPSWPYVKKQKRPKLQCPKDGCKQIPPKCLNPPCGLRPCDTFPTFPRRVYSLLDFYAISLNKHNILDNDDKI